MASGTTFSGMPQAHSFGDVLRFIDYVRHGLWILEDSGIHIDAATGKLSLDPDVAAQFERLGINVDAGSSRLKINNSSDVTSVDVALDSFANAFVVTSSAVGIGTSPTLGNVHMAFSGNAALVIDSTDSNDASVQFAEAGALKWSVDADATSWWVTDETNSQTPIVVNAGAANSNAIYVSATGQIASGHTNPSSKFHAVASSPCYIHAEATNSNSAAGVICENDAQRWYMRVDGAASDRWELHDGTNAVFHVAAGLSADTVVVNATGVGIGVSATLGELHVKDSASHCTIAADATGGSSNAYFAAAIAGTIKGNIGYASAFDAIVINTPGNLNTPFVLELGASSDSIHVSSASNVGLGDEADSGARLHIFGTDPNDFIRMESTDTDDYYALRITGGGELYLDCYESSSTTHRYPLQFDIDSRADALVVNQYGVGSGATCSSSEAMTVETSGRNIRFWDDVQFSGSKTFFEYSSTGRTLSLMGFGGTYMVVVNSAGVTLDGAVTLNASSTPANPSASSESRHYTKGGKFVIQYNDAGTVRYKYLDLTGTGTTWTHTTSAP